MTKGKWPKEALMGVYLIAISALAFNNIIWNWWDSHLWMEKIIHVLTNPYDQITAVLIAFIVVSFLGHIEW